MRRKSKAIILIVLSLCSILISFAQDSIPVAHQWKVESKKLADGKYELSFSTAPSGAWKIYAPNQTLLEVKTTELVFADSSIKQEGKFKIEASQVKEEPSSIFENTIIKILPGDALWKATITIDGTVPAQLQGSLLYTYGKNDEFYPATAVPFVVQLEGGIASTTKILVSSINISKPVNNCGDEGTKNKSILSIFLLGLLGGLIALLTPCVFPMIPVTVTFFTKKSHDKSKGIANAILYGLFIFLILINIFRRLSCT